MLENHPLNCVILPIFLLLCKRHYIWATHRPLPHHNYHSYRRGSTPCLRAVSLNIRTQTEPPTSAFRSVRMSWHKSNKRRETGSNPHHQKASGAKSPRNSMHAINYTQSCSLASCCLRELAPCPSIRTPTGSHFAEDSDHFR